MLEEKPDNLPEEIVADGNQEITENQLTSEPEATVEDEVETTDLESDDSETVTLTDEQVADETPKAADKSASVTDQISDANAEESEEDTIGHVVEMEDYESMSMETLVEKLEKLAATENVMAVKNHVEEVKKAFLSHYHHLLDEKKEAFEAENEDPTQDFHYNFPLKNTFDNIYSGYRDRKNKHFKSLQNNLENNLKNRLELVEELKELTTNSANMGASLKHVQDIRDRWKVAGAIPKDKYNHVWNNYHFHMENFYDLLDLDRDARDSEFKHNLELKQKIVERAQELVSENDLPKAFRELQDLHKIWKEDIGPVSRDHREDIWNQFSEVTKQMHDKREAMFEQLRGKETENLEKKNAIIAEIEKLSEEKADSHGQWNKLVTQVEAKRNEFFSAGKVPQEVNEETWANFKNATRKFNINKNNFYKEIKKEQTDNLTKKQALVEQAKAMQDSTDFGVTTQKMKQIQEDWKKIGHVPRKFSDAIWTEFRAACNHYFDKLKEQRNEENAEEIASFEKKKEYLESLKEFTLVGDHKTDLDAIKKHIENWKTFGRVPFGRRHIEGKFNKILDVLFEKLSLSKKDTEMMRFNNKIEQLAGNDDKRKLEGEKIFLIRKIEEVKHEMIQLENNIQFFTSAKSSKKENPMITEVRKNIAKYQEEIELLQEKLKQLRNLKQE